MDYEMVLLPLTVLVGGLVGILLLGFMRRANEWFYVRGFTHEKRIKLPPGDMGWPFIGNLWSFLRAFKDGGNPNLFISNIEKRYGSTGIYKTSLFGNPTILVTTSDTCKRVLMDNDNFGPGWPKSIMILMGKKGFHNGISIEEHKSLRKLTISSISSDNALLLYMGFIQQTAKTTFEEFARKKRPIELLTEMKKVVFKVTLHIILSTTIDERMLEIAEHEFSILGNGLKSMAIDLPGFAFHKALKARKELLNIFECAVEERRATMKSGTAREKKDMLDLMMEIEDDDGKKLSDEQIMDLIIAYLTAGHDTPAYLTTWAIVFLYENPKFMQKAREEQDQLIEARPSSQTGLSLDEIKNMKYLSKVIDETLRVINISFFLFREAKTDVNINGFLIPKGWKVLPWIRNIHVNSSTYPNPLEFDPSRWDNQVIRSGTFVPFGAGSRLCPGAALVKLELSIFLHYFLLNYKFERVNPKCGVKYLPVPKPKDNCLAIIKKLSA